MENSSLTCPKAAYVTVAEAAVYRIMYAAVAADTARRGEVSRIGSCRESSESRQRVVTGQPEPGGTFREDAHLQHQRSLHHSPTYPEQPRKQPCRGAY